MESAFFRDDIPNDGKVQRFSETVPIPLLFGNVHPPLPRARHGIPHPARVPWCAPPYPARVPLRGPVAVGRDVPIAPPRHGAVRGLASSTR